MRAPVMMMMTMMSSTLYEGEADCAEKASVLSLDDSFAVAAVDTGVPNWSWASRVSVTERARQRRRRRRQRPAPPAPALSPVARRASDGPSQSV